MTAVQINLPIERINAFCDKWKIRELALFGSVLREDFRSNSDVDVLVTFDENSRWNLWDVIDVQQELEGIFGRRVDFVEKKCVTNPFRRHAILTSKKVIYASDGT